MEAVIPAEIGMPTLRTTKIDTVQNEEALKLNLDLLEEKREQTAIREARSKAKMEKYYNSKVRNTSFKLGDLVYRSNDDIHAEDGGKLGPKWEGPYEVTGALGKGAYKLKDCNGKLLPLTWNTAEDLQGEELLHYDAEIELMNLILLSIPNEIYNSVDACTTAKEMWKRVERLMRGTIQNQVDRETCFTNEFDQFVVEPGEALIYVYNRFAQLMNDLERNKMIFSIVTVNTKFLNSLQPEWLKYVTQVRIAKCLTVDSFDDLFDYLQQFKKLVNTSRAKKLEKSHDPLVLVAHTGSSSRNTSSYYVTHPTSVVDYDDEYQQDDVQTNSEDPLASAMLLLARAITQNFSNPTNNRLRTSSNTRNQAIIQGDRVNIQSRNSGNTGRNTRRAYCQEEVVEGSNAQNETGNVQRTLRTSSAGNATTDEAEVILTDEQNNFLFADASRMEEIEELSANIRLLARIQPTDNTSDAGPSYDSAFISEVQSSSIKDNQEQMTLRTSSSGNTSTVQCYNCSGKGHYARNCPKPRVRKEIFASLHPRKTTPLVQSCQKDPEARIVTDKSRSFIFEERKLRT
ncbi:retrovirus-related pol polyprotein from transposon TNT 1-94 [Tanacetum coccineum]